MESLSPEIQEVFTKRAEAFEAAVSTVAQTSIEKCLEKNSTNFNGFYSCIEGSNEKLEKISQKFQASFFFYALRASKEGNAVIGDLEKHLDSLIKDTQSV